MAEIPEHLLRRSAEARAKADGRTVEDVLAEWRGEAPAPEAPAAETPASAEAAPAPAAAAAPAASVDDLLEQAAASQGLPAKLLRRSAEAKATATGTPLETVLAEMAGVETPAAEAPAAPAPAEAAPAPAAAAAPAASVDDLLEQAAASQGLPAKLLRRSAEAKAKATGTPLETVLAEMAGVELTAATPAEAPPVPAAAAAPAASVDDLLEQAAASQGLPAKLLRRSAEAKAKATGTPLEAVLAEMAGVEAPAAEAPAPEPAPAPAASVDDLLEKAAASQGLPAKLLRRSAEAKAKATGTSLETVLAEMAGVELTAATPAEAPPAPPAAAAPAPAVPAGGRTQRLLTVVKAKAIQQVRREPSDKVNVWPHLLAIEFVALLVVLGGLVVFSIFQDAPLLELANPNEQPNPSKAPWYFLGLQELLSYFDPQIAGVLIPGMGLAMLAIIPYIDRNPSTRPSDRKYAVMLFTFFVVAAAILTIIGSFFRGPGFNFTFPWRDGIFFDL